MARAHPILKAFNSGELTPKLFGRVDTEQYDKGAEELTNVIVTPFGGVERRPGTFFLGYARRATRLIPFAFSTPIDDVPTGTPLQNEVISLGTTINFYKDEVLILDATILTISSITNADPAVVTTSTVHGYSTSDVVYLEITGMTELDKQYFVIVVTSTTKFKLYRLSDTGLSDPIDSTAYGVFSSGSATKVQGLANPFFSVDAFSVQYAQIADIMYLTHPQVAPQKLSRSAPDIYTDIFTIAPTVFIDGPYMDENITATTLTPAATTGTNILVTASAITGINGGQGFLSTDVGRFIRINNSGADTWGYAKITTVNTTLTVHVTILTAFAATSATATWRLGAFSDTTGYPRAVTLFQGRAVYASTPAEPQRVWMSKSGGQLEDFTPGTADDDPITIELYSEQLNQIYWMVPMRSLLLGMSDAIRSVSGTGNAPLTPSIINVEIETRFGASNITPALAGNTIYYVQRDKRTIREMTFSLDSDAFVATNVSLIAEHFFTGALIHQIAYQQSPYGVLWVLTVGSAETGVPSRILTLTRETDQKVLGWSEHVTGAEFFSGYGGDSVASLTVLPANGYDQVWWLVQRWVDDPIQGIVALTYVEVMAKRMKALVTGFNGDAIFLDSVHKLPADQVASVILEDLGHLEGRSVDFLGDGSTFPPLVIDNGTLPAGTHAIATANVIYAGLAYTSRIKTLPPEAGTQLGSAQGRRQRIAKVTARVFETVGMKIGDEDRQDVVSFRDTSSDMNTAVPLFTGDKEIMFQGGYTSRGQVVVVQDQPLPLHLVCLMLDMETMEG